MRLDDNYASPLSAKPSTPDASSPSWLPLDVARAAVETALRAFLEGLQVEEGEPKALALRVTVGVGKSAGLRKVLAEVAPSILRKGHILVYVPTHALAEEAEAAFRALGTATPSMVLRGRDATNPEIGAPMCVKPDLAKLVAGIAPWGVTASLCQAQDPPEIGQLRRSLCRRDCPWFEQLPRDEMRIIFLPHAYLQSVIPGGIGKNVALRIIDEKFLPSISYTQTIYVDEWLESCACSGRTRNALPVCRHEARRLVHQALLQGLPIIAALKAAGVGQLAVQSFEHAERAQQPHVELTPWMTTSDQRRAVEQFDARAFFAARARARLWSMLQENWSTGSSERISLGVEPCPEGPPRSVIRMHSCGTIPRDAPLILLDADADPRIVETFVPGAEFVSIDVRSNAEVIQVEDQTFSEAALLTAPKAALRRREILDVVEREVERAPDGVLLVATKSVLRQLHLDEDRGCDATTDDDLTRPLRGALPRWFGPRMQGLNAFEDFHTAIVLGRLQPPLEAIEDQMRAAFGDIGSPLDLMPADDRTRGWFKEVQGVYLMADGTTRPARFRTHPDPRGAALLAQMREACTLQAIGRIRAVNALIPKRILILCSIPLLGLEIDHLVLWQELVTGLSRADLSTKMQTLESALYPFGRSMPLAGLRLSGRDIGADAPEVFKTPTSGANWRVGLPTDTVFDMVRAIARRRGGRPVFVLLRRRGGGKRTPAVLFDPPEDIATAVARLWPCLELAEVAETAGRSPA